MLIVSRKKLMLTRILMWGGIGLAVVGAVIFYASSQAATQVSIALLGGGLVLSLIGAALMKRLFRCPGCGKNVLGADSGVDLRTSKCPERCPHCGGAVRLDG